jgi:hypothetical protein
MVPAIQKTELLAEAMQMKKIFLTTMVFVSTYSFAETMNLDSAKAWVQTRIQNNMRLQSGTDENGQNCMIDTFVSPQGVLFVNEWSDRIVGYRPVTGAHTYANYIEIGNVGVQIVDKTTVYTDSFIAMSTTDGDSLTFTNEFGTVGKTTHTDYSITLVRDANGTVTSAISHSARYGDVTCTL